MNYFSTSVISLFSQFIILFGVIVSYIFLKKKKIVYHSYLLFSLFVIHIITVLYFMIPSTYNIISTSSLTNIGYMTIIHAVLGTIIFALSLYIFWIWRFKTPNLKCFKNKRLMLIVMTLWVLETILGVLEYYILYQL